MSQSSGSQPAGLHFFGGFDQPFHRSCPRPSKNTDIIITSQFITLAKFPPGESDTPEAELGCAVVPGELWPEKFRCGDRVVPKNPARGVGEAASSLLTASTHSSTDTQQGFASNRMATYQRVPGAQQSPPGWPAGWAAGAASDGREWELPLLSMPHQTSAPARSDEAWEHWLEAL